MLVSFFMTNSVEKPDRILCIDGRSLTLEDIESAARGRIGRFELDDGARAAMERSNDRVLEVIESGATVYGVNTGFGHFAQVRVEGDQLEQLQLNLVRSHAVGVGEHVPPA